MTAISDCQLWLDNNYSNFQHFIQQLKGRIDRIDAKTQSYCRNTCEANSYENKYILRSKLFPNG